MRRLVLMFVALFFGICSAQVARAQDSVQIFGGYSYLRPSVNVDSLGEHPNLNGWEVSGTYNMLKWLGATADFSGHYGTDSGANTHYQTYLFGPQVRLPGPVSPFAHVLIGAAHESFNAPGLFSASGNAFAAAVGAGIDIKLVPFVSLRPIQLDYLVTRFGSSTQNQPRASAGLVVHF